MSKKRFEQVWKLVCKDKEGKVRWTEEGPNDLADEGEAWMLDVFYRGGAEYGVPTTFYLRLFNDTPVETDTLANLIGEPSGNGYAAQEINRDETGWSIPTLDAGDYQIVSQTVTFNATGGSWGPVTYAVLASSIDNSGKLIAFKELSQARTLNDGESLEVTITIKQQ